MEERDAAKYLLDGKSCESCTRQKDGDSCVRFMGEAFGWQWWQKAREGVCDDWEGEKR